MLALYNRVKYIIRNSRLFLIVVSLLFFCSSYYKMNNIHLEELLQSFMECTEQNSEQSRREISNELVTKYEDKDFDINELEDTKFLVFCEELVKRKIQFRDDVVNRLYSGSNAFSTAWKSRCVIVNGNEYNMMKDCIQKEWKYNKQEQLFECVIDDKYEPIFQSFSKFIENKVDDYYELIVNLDRRTLNEFINNDFVNMTNEDVHCFFFPIYSPLLRNTVLFGQEYDSYLREWVGDYNWKLIYRASEHGYTAKSFHEYCDDKGPTLVIIKSSEGWIFGGYTTQSWSGDGI